MQAKVLYSIILIGLICAGAGCLSPNSRPEFPAASSNTAGNHDAVLERFVAADYNATALNVSISSWQVKWVNSTALIINAAGKQAGTNNNVSISKTVKRFASMNDANDTMRAYDLSNYAQVPNGNATSALYAKAVGKDAAVFRAYEKTTRSSSSLTLAPSLTLARVTQFNDIIAISDTTIVQTPTPTPTPTALPRSPSPTATAAPPQAPTPEPTASPSATPKPGFWQTLFPWLYPNG
jgi:hypothetical protein